jgi:protein-L-isoaspartate(D-aspartate) O-methyltransferase
MLSLAPTFDGRRTVPSKEVTDLMLELLQLTPQDKVMEIGTGSGYQTRRLAQTGAEIHSIELEPYVDPTIPFGECVYLYHRDGFLGLPEVAPFTAIVATCGLTEIPAAWVDQLRPEGRIVVPIGRADAQRLALFTKLQGHVSPKRIAAYVRFQMMRAPDERKPLKPVYKDRPEE